MTLAKPAARFRSKRSFTIEAIQLTHANLLLVHSFCGNIFDSNNPVRYVHSFSDRCEEDSPFYLEATIPTPEGNLIARHGDWIIRGLKGELYPCKPDVFDAKYEPAETEE